MAAFAKAQLKDSKGYLLSPTGELQELRKYATDVFGKYPRLQDNFVELPTLEANTLAQHIASIKPGKAVPKGAAPAASWKICAQPIAEVLAHYCRSLPLEEHLDDGLLSADLCLIPKPGKPADKPTQLRPLGILRPDAKGLAGAAREMLAPHVIPFMKPLPQFAYLPGRGCRMHRAAWCSICGRLGKSVALRSQVGRTGSGDLVHLP